MATKRVYEFMSALSKSKQLKSTTWYFLHSDVLKEKKTNVRRMFKVKSWSWLEIIISSPLSGVQVTACYCSNLISYWAHCWANLIFVWILFNIEKTSGLTLQFFVHSTSRANRCETESLHLRNDLKLHILLRTWCFISKNKVHKV